MLCALQLSLAACSISTTAPRSGAFVPDALSPVRPFWLWPHLLSLDAPLIAVLWQVLLAQDLLVRVSRGELLVLGLCVWLVYVADRVFDVVRHPFGEGWEPARRTFYRTHLRIASFVGVCLLSAVLPLAYCVLRNAAFHAGLVLAVPLLFYLALVHLAPMQWRTRWPREAVIACVFTGGTFLAVWVGNGGHAHPLWPPAMLFSLLCWANLCAIEVWEWRRSLPDAEGAPSGSTRWAAQHLISITVGIACLAGFAGWVGMVPAGFSAAVFFSGIALAALAAGRSRLSMNSVRVAADLALCTPLLVLAFAFLQ